MERQKLLALIAGVALVVIAGVVYYENQKSSAPAEAPPAPPPPAPQEPAIRNPVPEAAPEQPLPALNESDAAVRTSLSGIYGADAVKQFLTPRDVIRRVVVTVDNLPRKKVAVELRPLVPTAGKFATSGTEDNITLDPRNYSRYAPIVKLVEATDAKTLSALYFRYYPLFQRAYEDLGYPKAYFNDRLVEVIDDLLATPKTTAPVKLLQPRVFYEFADPDLESRSAGQKLLLRMGNENAAVIKAKLTEFRALIAKAKPPAGT